MNLPQQVNLSCEADCTVASVSYAAGVLTVVADYETSVEEHICNLTLDFDSSIILSPPVILSFTVKSATLPLVVSQLKDS
jgi:hypothetical protein